MTDNIEMKDVKDVEVKKAPATKPVAKEVKAGNPQSKKQRPRSLLPRRQRPGSLLKARSGRKCVTLR